jgi:hypothetical protein
VNHDQLFIETMNDLKSRVDAPRSEYEAIMSSALLRKLLLDSPTLVDLANRSRRMSIEFVVNGRPPIWKALGEEPPTAYAIEDGFDPETALVKPLPMTVTRDRLLSSMVAVYRGQEITAKTLLRYVANTAGGVHFDPPRNDEESAAHALAEQMRVGGYPAGMRTVLALGRVVERALGPLREQVEREIGRPTGSY